MLFETKIALVIRDDLASWQKMNVAAFSASGIAASYPVIDLFFRSLFAFLRAVAMLSLPSR